MRCGILWGRNSDKIPLQEWSNPLLSGGNALLILEDAVNIKLAEIAKKEALKCYHGHVMGAQSNLHPLAERFHAPDCTADTLDNCWCAAFVYHCVLLSGYNLPVKAKQAAHSFGWVRGWEEWAKSDAVRLWKSAEAGPAIGDIVLFDAIYDGNAPDHIAIVIGFSPEHLQTAEGNFNNVSAIVERGYAQVRGYIQLGAA